MRLEIRKALPDIAAGFRIILHAIEIKLCALDLDAADIVLSLQRILIEPEDPPGDALYLILHAIQMENVKHISIKMQMDSLLPAKCQKQKRLQRRVVQKMNRAGAAIFNQTHIKMLADIPSARKMPAV